MTPPLTFIFGFTVLPLIFMICMAFTNYSKIDNHLVLFDWVGLDNFRALFDSGSILGSTFWSVLSWTLVWAFLQPLPTIFLDDPGHGHQPEGDEGKGILEVLLRVILRRSHVCVPADHENDAAAQRRGQRPFKKCGADRRDASLPFFTNPTWARVTIIVINIWVGVPYTLLQLTGVLQSIPEDLYEAARVDGANSFQTFFKITLPYMLYITTPYLIATFTGNVNNFNVIYLLSSGDPVTDLASTAGKTDLLVTWLYKLTIDKQYYNIGAVIGILTFIILAVGALFTYRNSKSYKEGGGVLR